MISIKKNDIITFLRSINRNVVDIAEISSTELEKVVKDEYLFRNQDYLEVFLSTTNGEVVIGDRLVYSKTKNNFLNPYTHSNLKFFLGTSVEILNLPKFGKCFTEGSKTYYKHLKGYNGTDEIVMKYSKSGKSFIGILKFDKDKINLMYSVPSKSSISFIVPENYMVLPPYHGKVFCNGQKATYIPEEIFKGKDKLFFF